MPDVLPSTIDAAFVPVARDAIHTVEIDGEAVLLDERENRLHHLNATATLVWKCLDGRSTVGDIVTDASEVLGAPYDLVLADTIAVCRDLGAQGLLAGVQRDRPPG